MGHHTSRHFSLAAVVSVFCAFSVVASVGCASGDAEETGSEEPAAEADKNTDDGEPEEKTADTKKEPAPAFNATFDPNQKNEETDPTKDPAPPGGTAECIDNNDPGSAENVATKLPDTDDCDDNIKTISGVMKGAVDVDFYKLSATDKGPSLSHPLGCLIEPHFESQTAGTELCVYMRCKNSTVDAVKGCEQGSEKTSEIGMKGCCAAGPGRAIPKWDCKGLFDNDSADIFMSVKQINGDKCMPYKVRYRF